MRDHTKLKAFKLADELAILTYQVTLQFPKAETYGLRAQMRSACISVPSNIVEGCARRSKLEYVRFLDFSYGSLKELHYQFSLGDRLGYFKEGDMPKCESKLIETEKVLSALIRSLRK